MALEGAIWDAVNNPSATSEQLELLPEVARIAKENGDIQALDKSIYSYKCNVCGEGKKPFSGLHPLQDHLNGKDHKKMKRLINSTSAFQIGASSNSAGASSNSAGASSNSAGASSNSAGASSNSATKNTLLSDSTISALPPEIQNLLENKTIKIVESNGIISYECLICNVPLTDVAPVKQHINGKPHGKILKQRSIYVPDSQGSPQPPEDMEWNNTNSSQDSQMACNNCSEDIDGSTRQPAVLNLVLQVDGEPTGVVGIQLICSPSLCRQLQRLTSLVSLDMPSSVRSEFNWARDVGFMSERFKCRGYAPIDGNRNLMLEQELGDPEKLVEGLMNGCVSSGYFGICTRSETDTPNSNSGVGHVVYGLELLCLALRQYTVYCYGMYGASRIKISAAWAEMND